jgi:hypothetical protein
MPRIAKIVWERNQEKCLFKRFFKSDKNGTYFDIDINDLLYLALEGHIALNGIFQIKAKRKNHKEELI